jgi:hypothetical protein
MSRVFLTFLFGLAACAGEPSLGTRREASVVLDGIAAPAAAIAIDHLDGFIETSSGRLWMSDLVAPVSGWLDPIP